MISLRQHNASDYAQLPVIDEGDSGIITAADQAYLDAFGALLAKRQATHRFGASLLHNHFPLNERELMVESIDRSRRVSTLRPLMFLAAPHDATNVYFSVRDGERGGYELIGLEYTRDLGDIPPIGDQDSIVLDATFSLLAQHGMRRRFGVRLIYDPLVLDSGLALLETCDSKQRVLTCNVVQNSSVDFRQSIPTFFTWRVIADEGEIAQGCQTVCNVTQACLFRPDGGHESHGSHDPNHESDGNT
jgi:hypothetical protein